MKKLLLTMLVLLLFTGVAQAQNVGGLWRISDNALQHVAASSISEIWLINPARNDTVKIGDYIDLTQFDSAKTNFIVVGNQAFPTTLGSSGQVLKSDGSTVVWGTDNQGSGPWTNNYTINRDSLGADREGSFQDSVIIAFVARQITGFDVSARQGTVMDAFNNTLDMSRLLIKTDSVLYKDLAPATGIGGPYSLTVDDIYIASESQLDLLASLRIGINQSRIIEYYYGAQLQWQANDSVFDGQGTLDMKDLAQMNIAGSSGSGIISVSGGVDAANYMILANDSISDWEEIVPLSAVYADSSGAVDTSSANSSLRTLIQTIGGENPDSVFGHDWVIPTLNDSSLVWYDSTDPGDGRWLALPMSELRSYITAGTGLWDSTGANPDSIWWSNGTIVAATMVTNSDTTTIGAGANSVLRVGVAAGPTIIANQLRMDTLDVKDDGQITVLTPDIWPDSAVDYPLEYLEVVNWAGLGHYTEDSVELIGPMFARGAGGFVVDTTVGGTGGSDTIMAIVPVPFDCTLDSLIFTINVTDGTCDSIALVGPARTSFTNRMDSTYYTSTTGWNPASATRYVLDLSAEVANAGERFGVIFFNSFPGVNDAVRIGPVQLVAQR